MFWYACDQNISLFQQIINKIKLNRIWFEDLLNTHGAMAVLWGLPSKDKM